MTEQEWEDQDNQLENDIVLFGHDCLVLKLTKERSDELSKAMIEMLEMIPPRDCKYVKA